MKKIALLLGIIVLFTTTAYATPVINQTANGNTTPVDSQGYSYVNILTNPNYGASFTANTTTLDGAGFYLSDPLIGGFWSINPSAVFTVGLYDISATLLGSGSFTNATGGWHDVFFNDVPVNIGSKYYVFASADYDLAGVITFQFAGPGNIAFLYNGTIFDYGSSVSTIIDARIFTNDGYNPVPEPGTLALLGLGIAGLALYGKRRQNKA